VWKTAKPHCTHKKTRIADDEICTSFLRILLSFLMNYSRTTNYKPVSGLFSLFIYHPQRFNVFYHQVSPYFPDCSRDFHY